MVDVQLEIIDLSTGQTIGNFSLDICTPKTYELDLGSYRFKATYLPTGEIQTKDANITEGTNTSIDLTFTPLVTPVNYTLTVNSEAEDASGNITPLQGVPFTIERVS